jgi:hypothetical protein
MGSLFNPCEALMAILILAALFMGIALLATWLCLALPLELPTDAIDKAPAQHEGA